MPSSSASPLVKPRWSPRGVADAALWVGLAGAFGLCVLTFAAFAGERHWLPEVTTHFRPHYGVLLLLCAGVYALARRRRLAAILLIVAILNALPLFPRFAPQSPPPPGSPHLKLLLANIHTDNRDYDATLALVRREQPDVIALLEVSDTWLAALQPLAQSHPYVRSVPRSDNFGIVVFSRLPLTDVKTLYLSPSEVPSISATVTLPEGSQISLLATHPIPPGSAERVLLRDHQLAAIARWSKAAPHPAIVIGDLNCAPWSPAFRRLLKDGALTDTGFGISPTWPVEPWFLRIPLDHCLTSGPLFTVEHRVGPDIGSDHFPVLVTLALPVPPSSHP